jgi:hypothetical protein
MRAIRLPKPGERLVINKRSNAYLAALALALAACTNSSTKTDAPLPSGTVDEGAVTATATVESIDVKTRMLTLRTSDGQLMTVYVDDRVTNLPQVRKGDHVKATYYESLAYEVKRPGETSSSGGVTVTDAAGHAQPGEKPAAAGARVVTITATIESIDKAKMLVTLKGPDGNYFTVKAKDPKKVEAVKVGDLVDITYTRALAISVEEARTY